MSIGVGSKECDGLRKFVVFCDHCGEEVLSEEPANVVHEDMDGMPVYFLHKECSLPFRKNKMPMVWGEFVGISIRRNNVKATCSHLLGTAMRTVDGQHIIVYVTDWKKTLAWKQTDKYNFCPKCGQRVNANVGIEPPRSGRLE